METVLYVAHPESDGTLNRVALEALNTAVNICNGLSDAKLVVGLFGEDVQNSANSIANCNASSFIAVSGADFAKTRYCTDSLAIEALAKESNATIVVAPSTSRIKRSVPGAVQRLGGKIDANISGYNTNENTLNIERWYYRQRMMATLSRTERPWFVTVDRGVSDAWEITSGATATVEAIPVTVADTNRRTEVEGIQAPASDAQTIRPDAKLLFVAGAGWTKKQSDGAAHVKEAQELISTFLDHTKASLGSSKSLVDQSSEGQEVMTIMSHLNQVGQTGSTPRHPKGLATCCHGEEPHVVGWRFIGERRVINTDPNCSWAHGKADVVYVADAFAVLKELNNLLG